MIWWLSANKIYNEEIYKEIEKIVKNNAHGMNCLDCTYFFYGYCFAFEKNNCYKEILFLITKKASLINDKFDKKSIQIIKECLERKKVKKNQIFINFKK